MNALLKALILAILESLAGVYKYSRSAISADRDEPLLRRAGSRISQWLQQSRVHPRKQPDPNRPKLQDKGLPPD